MMKYCTATLFGVILFILVTNLNIHASTRVRAAAETVHNHAAVRLSTSHDHTCHVREDGTVRCWGRNDEGQLGDGTETPRDEPVNVTTITFDFFGSESVVTLNRVIAVEASVFHSCALIVDGTVRCWGLNDMGQLGDGTDDQRTRAVRVSGLSNAVAIAVGGRHSCALIADGTARCWGNNSSGQIGDGTDPTPGDRRLTPTPVNGLTNAVAITAGHVHTCALIADGTVRCWGSTLFGQIGLSPSVDGSEPVFGVQSAIAIAAGERHTCAIVGGGTVRCWGENTEGQLGDGTTSGRNPIPVSVNGSQLFNAVAIAAGTRHTCALLADGTAACWGRNLDGQIGDGTTGNLRPQPTTVVSLAGGVAIATGDRHSCALVANGEALCWGDNSGGQLGNGTPSDSPLPTPVAGGGGSVSATGVTAGGLHSCAVRANGTASCWGSNSDGQIGDGTIRNLRPQPTAVADLVNATAIAAGDTHTCGRLADGTARCWGNNIIAQIGDGTFFNENDRPKPTPVSNLSNAVAVAAGDFHSCGLSRQAPLDNRTPRCWGRNSDGQIGDGDTDGRRETPNSVSPRFDAVAIAVGDNHSCALRPNGTVRCWGDNSQGQLGGGTPPNDALSPIDVTGLGNVVAIAAGGAHTCALLADGTARCWGANASGQLGDNTTTPRPTLTTVLGLVNAIAIAAGDAHTCALIADGTARCWGDNTTGAIGDGTLDQRRRPTPVGPFVTGGTFVSLGGLVQIAAGRTHTCAAKVDGGIVCWGDNSFNQVVEGSTSDRLRPVAVPSFTLNIDPVVELKGKRREVIVNIIATCEEGDRLRVRVELTQGSVRGHGHDQFECTGALTKFPVEVRAHGRNTFVPGPAHAEAEADIRDRGLVDHQEWNRDVEIVVR